MACNCGCEGIEIPQGLPGATGATGPAGAAGTNGTNGTNGADGVAILSNQISNNATTGTSLETLKTYSLPAAKLNTDGDAILIKARFSTSTYTTVASTKTVGIYFNGSLLGNAIFSASNIDVMEFDVWINRTSNTSIKYKPSLEGFYKIIPISAGKIGFGFTSIGGLNLTTTSYNIDAKGNSDVTGDLTCESLQVFYYKKS